MLPQPMVQLKHYVFAWSNFCPVPSVFLSLRKNAERISINYHQQIRPKWLHLGEIGTGTKEQYNRKFELTSIGLAAI